MEIDHADAGVYDAIDYYNVVSEERLRFLQYIEQNVVGGEARFNGPFGERQVVYCDYTASGRPLKFIEDYIQKNVLPHYGNTHTTTTIVSKQTTKFRTDAKDLIKKSVNVGDDDAVIFCGSGATGAIHKLYQVMQLTEEKAKTTVVFVGPFEHHSNILPWKESGAKVIRVKETENGTVDTGYLEEQLKAEKKNGAEVMMGVFSAASNVTGILTDTNKVSALLHRYGALAFWDYATAGPYLNVEMNPPSMDGSDCSKDAVFISPHKFVGGVGTPGLLIAKRCLFKNRVPASAGGGTVSYVSREKHYYLKDIEAREEGGTPAITESIRAGMAFQLKDAVGTDVIEAREEELCRRAFDRWQHNRNLIILGCRKPRRLPIFSFLVRHEKSGKLLHHNFVCTLLNDLYGIQARGGCACAGPYAHDLLGISEKIADKFIRILDEDRMKKENKQPLEALRPGFARINLPYFMHDDAVDYVLEAIDQIATNGWKLLPYYRFNPNTGAWDHRYPPLVTKASPGNMSLLDITFQNGWFDAPFCQERIESLNLKKVLAEAEIEYDSVDIERASADILGDPEFDISDVEDYFQWFLQPREALHCMTTDNGPEVNIAELPIKPLGGNMYPEFRREISRESGYNSEDTNDFEFESGIDVSVPDVDDGESGSMFNVGSENEADYFAPSKKRKLEESGYFENDSFLSDISEFAANDIDHIKRISKRRKTTGDACFSSFCKHEQCLCEVCFTRDSNKFNFSREDNDSLSFSNYSDFALS
ncbi:uncharacterized protein LOC100375561 [Saccoglossus kowalevskii]|uniref:Uncharacterized protein LOC100375561 n=1 Tax=Saccoglossus kowalevskii TaxID=10224 RepID=A0ABM0LWB5_SACKO|nr:PREDICTED: uncharacterized protein LOC100375561 [Saccoglossus kowalevskii]